MKLDSEKRKFKAKLTGFEQLWNELERLEAREEILVRTIGSLMDARRGDFPKEDFEKLFQSCANKIKEIGGRSRGFKMIERMGIEFYDEFKKETDDDLQKHFLKDGNG